MRTHRGGSPHESLPETQKNGPFVYAHMDGSTDESLLCIAAGDGPSDVGMLEQANICLCPQKLDSAVDHSGH